MNTVKVSRDIVAPVVPVFRQFAGAHLGAGSDPAPRAASAEGPFELTAFERNRMYTITRYTHGVRIDTTFRFEPVRGATRVTAEFTCVPDDGGPEALETPMFAREERVAEALIYDLTALKHSIETPLH